MNTTDLDSYHYFCFVLKLMIIYRKNIFVVNHTVEIWLTFLFFFLKKFPTLSDYKLQNETGRKTFVFFIFKFFLFVIKSIILIPSIKSLFWFKKKVNVYWIYHVLYVVIEVRVNIMVSIVVMVVLDFLNVQSIVIVYTRVVHKPINMENVQWIKHIEINVVLVDYVNVLKLIWIKMVGILSLIHCPVFLFFFLFWAQNAEITPVTLLIMDRNKQNFFFKMVISAKPIVV